MLKSAEIPKQCKNTGVFCVESSQGVYECPPPTLTAGPRTAPAINGHHPAQLKLLTGF